MNIKRAKEGMLVAVPLVLFVGMFGTMAWKGFEQDRKNDLTRVHLQEAKKQIAKYKTEQKHLDRTIEMMASEIEDLKADNEGLTLSVEKLKQDRILYLDGKIYIARQEFTAEATAYTQRDEEGTADGITKTGTKAKEGRTIAVDPRLIPLGSIVYIESDSPLIGGFYKAEDTGGAIKGHKVDVFMDSLNKAFKFGRQKIKVTVLEGADL